MRLDILYLAPQFIIYFTMTILPFIIALPIVLTDRVNVLDQDVAFVGLQNFVTVWLPPIVDDFLPAVGRTALFTIINYGMIYVFGMSLALMMYEFRRNRFQRPLFVIIYLPYMMSGVGVGLLISMLFARDTGSINLLLQTLGVIQDPIDLRGAVTTTVALPLIVGWRFAGYNMAIFLSGLMTIPEETIEASVIDGATYLQRLRHIYFPQMMSSILIATIFCIIGSFGIVDEPIGMGGLYANKNAEFLSIVLLNYGFGSASGVSGTLSQAIAMSLTVYFPLFIVAFFLTRRQKKAANL